MTIWPKERGQMKLGTIAYFGPNENNLNTTVIIRARLLTRLVTVRPYSDLY